MGKFQDLTGQQFYHLKALSPTNKRDSHGSVIWKFQCDCGNIVERSGTEVKGGNIKSCGCIKPYVQAHFKSAPNRPLENLIGQKFSRLTVLEKVEGTNYHNTKYLCQCDCGNTIKVKHLLLKNGRCKSCGCYRKEQAIINGKKAIKTQDITNKKFNKLTAIECLDPTFKTTAKWKCQCDCGEITYLTASDLLSGKTKSCGCLNSVAEYEIDQLLHKLNIQHKHQYYFQNLKGSRGGYLRFDFALFKKDKLICLIEYDGFFHYRKSKLSYKGQNVTDICQEHDQLKNDYCKKNNITLYRIHNKRQVTKDIYYILIKEKLRMNKNMTLLCDFYKVFHRETYPKNMTMMYSTWTPRSNQYSPESSYVVWFGLQGFIKTLKEDFDTYFFNRDINEICAEYELYIHNTFNEKATTKHLKELHKLGYLPLEIQSLPEGSLVPFRVPCATICNTDPRFAFLTNYLETLWSCSMWLPTTSATTAYNFRKVLEHYIELTSDNKEWKHLGCGDFSYRGMGSPEAAITSGAGFLTSFTKTSTIPCIKYICEYYNADVAKEDIGSWSASLEHSCTTSNYAIDGSEEELFVRMCTEICPDRPFSYVTDSYDHFGFLNNIVRKHKDLVMKLPYGIRFRPDSGDPESIICGTTNNTNSNSTLEEKGSLKILEEIFGSHVNSKGYKVLNNNVGIVYGDAINYDRLQAICKRLVNQGWAIENVIFGVGSYTLQYKTRDSQGWAYKATYAEVDGKPIFVFKDPKTDRESGHAMKKSQKGCVLVYWNGKEYAYRDGYTWDELKNGTYYDMFRKCEAPFKEIQSLTTVFKDGKIYNEETFEQIRNRLHKEF